MKDERKTKEQLIEELEGLRGQLVDHEALETIAAAGFAQAEITSQPPHVSSPFHGGEPE